MLKFFKKISIYYILLIQIIMLIFLPAMDGKMNLFRIIVYSIFAVLSLYVVLIYIIKQKIKMDTSFFFIFGFVLLCTISGIWGIIKGISITDICRGILPFVWLIYILILNQTLNDKEFRNLLRLIGIISLLYSIRIIIYYLIYVAGHPYERVTFHLVQSTSVIPMIGTLLFFYYSIKEQKIKISSLLGMFICYISVILTETKSMLLSLIVGIIIYIIIFFIAIGKQELRSSKYILRNSISALSIIFIILILMFSFTNTGLRWKNTITITKNESNSTTNDNQAGTQIINGNEDNNEQADSENNSVNDNNQDSSQIADYNIEVVDQGSISVRLVEYKTAISKWLESPILGQGIGYRWQADGIDYGGPVIYMHNILAFTLMDFGLLGIVYLCFIIISMCVMIVRALKRKIPFNSGFYVLFSSVIMAFIYANFFAVFRSIDFIVVCSVMIAMMIFEYNVYKK